MYCIYPWECVGGGACMRMYVFTLGHKDTERSAGKSQCIQYEYIRTPGAHTVHMYTCGVLSNTRAHCAGLQIQLTAAETPLHPLTVEFFLFSFFFGFHISVWIPLWIGLNCNSAWKRHRVPLTEAVDLAEMVTELNFHGDAFEKCCLGLIDYENHWIQQFSWGLCYKLSKDGLSEKLTQTFVPIHPVLVLHCSPHTFMVRGALGGPP